MVEAMPLVSREYNEAVGRWPLTDEAVEAAAKALAVSICGGDWETHFAEGQKALWRRRVRAAMEVL